MSAVPSSSISVLSSACLVGGVEAAQGRGDLTVDVLDSSANALAAPALAAVAKLGGLVLARRGTGGNRRVTVCAGAQPDLDLDGRVTTAVENLAGVDSLQLTHTGGTPPCALEGFLEAGRRDGGPAYSLVVTLLADFFGALYCLQSVTTYSPLQSVFPSQCFLNSLMNLLSASC